MYVMFTLSVIMNKINLSIVAMEVSMDVSIVETMYYLCYFMQLFKYVFFNKNTRRRL